MFILKHCTYLKCHHMRNHPVEEDPLDGSSGEDILVVGDEVDFLPDVAEEVVDRLLAEVVSAVEPARAENADIEVHDFAGFVEGLERIVKGGSIVPFEVVGENAQLVLNDVEVAAIGPVVP